MSSATPSLATPSLVTPSAGRVWLRGGIAAIVAAVLNVVVATIEVTAFSLSAEQISLQPGPVIAFTVIGIIAGTVVFLILRRRGSRGERLFVIVAVVVGALSLLLPVAMMVDPGAFPGGSVTGGAALIPIHLIATVTAIAALTVRLPSKKDVPA